MDAKHLMERAENALRTGQTENLFPVIAARALKKIAEEKETNRREWEQLNQRSADHVAALRMTEAFRTVREAFQQAWDTIQSTLAPAVENIIAVFETINQGDFALAAPANNQE